MARQFFVVISEERPSSLQRAITEYEAFNKLINFAFLFKLILQVKVRPARAVLN